MKSHDLWLKFISSGKPSDYLEYVNSLKVEKLEENKIENNNRCARDSRESSKG